MGILEANNTNWYGTVMTIWTTLPKEIRQYLPPPSPKETLDEYMYRVEEARQLIVAVAKDAYPNAKYKTESKTYDRSKPNDKSRYSRNDRYDRNDRNERSNRYDRERKDRSYDKDR